AARPGPEEGRKERCDGTHEGPERIRGLLCATGPLRLIEPPALLAVRPRSRAEISDDRICSINNPLSHLPLAKARQDRAVDDAPTPRIGQVRLETVADLDPHRSLVRCYEKKNTIVVARLP